MDGVVLIVNYEHLHYNNLVFHFKVFLFNNFEQVTSMYLLGDIY